MYCPNCQTKIPVQVRQCPVCGYALSTTMTVHPSSTTVSPHLACPTCKSTIPANSQNCPVCGSITLVPNSTIQTIQPPSNYLEGVILGAPRSLTDEPRDVDWIQAIAVSTIVIEVGIIALSISLQMVTIAFMILVMAIFFSFLAPFLGTLGTGCLSSALIPFRLLGLLWQPLLTAFDPGRDPRNMRQVQEYRVRPYTNSTNSDVFIVKGLLSPRSLRDGDEVRIWIRERAGRPFFSQGEVRDPYSGNWIPLRIVERHTGIYWLIGAVILTLYILSLILQN